MTKSKKWVSIVLHLYLLFCGVVFVLFFIVNGLNAEDLKAIEPYCLDTNETTLPVLFSQLSNFHSISMSILFAFLLCIIIGCLPFWKKGKMLLQLGMICYMIYQINRIMYHKTLIAETMSARLSNVDFVSEKVNALMDIPNGAVLILCLSIILLLLCFIDCKVSLTN